MNYFKSTSLFLIFIATQGVAQEKTLYFQAKDAGPSIYMTPTSVNASSLGIIPRLFDEVITTLDITVVYQNAPSRRVEEYLNDGQLDGSIMNKEWMKNLDDVIFTIPFINYQVFIYSLTPIGKNKTFKTILSGKRICTHRGYSYSEFSELSTLFDNNTSFRVDSDHEPLMIKMLLKERCDIALIDEHSADWLFKTLQINKKIFKYPTPLISTNLTLAFNKKWYILVEKLNDHIRALNASSKMDEIINNAKYGTN